MKMDTIPELPEATKLSARLAFIASCAQFGVQVPLDEVAAETVVDVDGPNLQLFWWTGFPVRHHAEGRYYPARNGGEVELFFLRSKDGIDIALGSTAPALDSIALTFINGSMDSSGH